MKDTGIYPGITGIDYHADRDSYSSSLIKLMNVPALAKYQMDNPPEYKDCFRIGSAVHKFILERDDFEAEFLTGIDCPRRSSDNKMEWATWFFEHGANGDLIVSHKAAEWNPLFEQETGKHMMTPEEIKEIALMAESVAANDEAMTLLEGGIAEASIYWTDKETGISLRCRPDYLTRACTDLKTCQSASEHAVAREIHNRGYHISAAMYSHGVNEVTGQYAPFVFLFIEKAPPYLCAVYSMDEESAELGWNTYRAHLNKLAECLETGIWPGIPNNLAVHLPAYAFFD